jgi:hypothetical protein
MTICVSEVSIDPPGVVIVIQFSGANASTNCALPSNAKKEDKNKIRLSVFVLIVF